jgi:uncharacterized membrane protein
MGTYIIIGGDGKEYGPITSADLRQWVIEGRLNGLSMAKSTSDAEFRPLEKFPEFADLFSGAVLSTIAPMPSANEMGEDYELDLGGCISRGWELTKQNFGTLFVSTLVFIGIKIALSSVLNFTLVTSLTKLFPSAGATVALGVLVMALNAPIMGPLLGGVYLIFLKTIRGEATGIGEIFAGFQKCWSQLFLGSLVVDLVGIVCMAPASYVVAAKINPIVHQLQSLQAQGSASADVGKLMTQMFSAYAGCLPIVFICLIPVTYLAVSWQFTLALVIDKNWSFGTAMKTSWRRVNQHWWQVFGLTILAGLIGIIGALACGVGVLFTIPIGFAIMMYGYETIFGAKKY